MEIKKPADPAKLTDFEKKHLIKRELKGKTYAVHLTENFCFIFF